MKKIGMQPIPMMDRDKKDEVPQGQVLPNLGKENTALGFFKCLLKFRYRVSRLSTTRLKSSLDVTSVLMH